MFELWLIPGIIIYLIIGVIVAVWLVRASLNPWEASFVAPIAILFWPYVVIRLLWEILSNGL